MVRCFLLLILGVFLLRAAEVQAQRVQAQRVPGFSQRPTISPYVNLFNNRTGGVNNYFQFVRPLQQQIRTNQVQTAQNNLFQQQLLGNQGFGAVPTSGSLPFGQQQGLLRPANLGVGQQAIPASYFNYSHYYYNTPVNLQQQQRGGRRTR